MEKAPRKGAHRRKRERRPLPGMMHQDGSRHVWLEGQPALDLIVTLDDAEGEIPSQVKSGLVLFLSSIAEALK